jgi:DNA modification methylase
LIGLFEGDIVPDSKTILENYGPHVLKELEDEGILNPPVNDGGYVYQNVETSNRWSTRVNDIVHVPYVLSSQYNPTEVSTIKKALADLGDRSKVVKFVTREYQSDYLMLKPISGCYSYVGKQGGEQDISLKGYCVSKGVTQHEVMHALGIFHEQSRPDRDEYVRINWQNIDSSRQHNFAKKTNTKTLGNAYDYGSVMHYPNRAFSNNNKETITTPNGQSIGQRSGADQKDILDIRLLYQCISGERTLSEYNDNRCTEDCKCWKGEKGCNGRNNACQGSLVCTNNMCQDGSGGSPNIGPSTTPPTASPRTTSPRTTSPTRSGGGGRRGKFFFQIIENRG